MWKWEEQKRHCTLENPKMTFTFVPSGHQGSSSLLTTSIGSSKLACLLAVLLLHHPCAGAEHPPLLHEGSCFLLAPAQHCWQPWAACGASLTCLFSSLPPSMLLGSDSQCCLLLLWQRNPCSVALFLVHW